ncbi:22778_t:CDS:2 [Dentiscutata erythropus]|uniref:ubiquitinyl hydrolase 1 n=1 Tax=Dentiscutata erythropus TaxID=1348616 RepID=A0A9N9HUC0_9GLOM|nr:22778_t:CDS:2 [Dentiscutata erythropus]
MKSNKYNNSKFYHRSSLHARINRNSCSQANLAISISPLAPPSKGVGLCNNTGVDCFINSTLQCLMHTQPFANFLERNFRCTCSGFCGLRELSILRMCALKARYMIRNRDLHRNLKVIDPCADFYHQNDAFLFLCGLISNQIERCCNSLQTTTAFFDRVFKTTWRNEVICTICSHKSITYKQEQAIQVGLGKMLIDSVRDWAGPYPLHDYKCDKCNNNICTQKCNLTRLPEILIIQVKRFSYDRGLQRCVKVNDHMSYNEILDMSEFCVHPGEDARYRLSASIVHVGSSPRSGHYYAYAKTASGWVKFNDSATTNVLLETTLRDKPYILFYTKQNTSSTATILPKSEMKMNTTPCNTIQHVTKPQFNHVSLNDKPPDSIQPLATESMVSIKSTEEWQVQKNQQNALSNSIINNQFSSDTPRTMVNDRFINEFCQINTASNKQRYDENSPTTSICSKGPNASNTNIIEYGQCRWVVENVPSINFLNNDWKRRFSRNGSNLIRKKRRRLFKKRA